MALRNPAKSPADLLAPDRPLTLCQCRGRRRGAGHRRSRACRRRPQERAGDERAGGLPRRPAHGGAGALARVLRARHRGAAVPGLGLPALRPRVAARGDRRAAHDRAVAACAHRGPRQAGGAAHHRQCRAPARAGDRYDRGAGAVGRAGQHDRHGRRDPMAGAQRLQPRFDGARARRLCRARRHPRSVRAGHGPAGAARFLRRHAGDHPQLRSGDPAHRDGHARARSRAGRGVPAHHRHDPQVPHRLCRGLRRRRSATTCSTRR